MATIHPPRLASPENKGQQEGEYLKPVGNLHASHGTSGEHPKHETHTDERYINDSEMLQGERVGYVDDEVQGTVQQCIGA
jgi:hypothetical protein